MGWAEERARLLGFATAEPIVKDAAYYAPRCWRHDCDELRDPSSDKWCPVHLADRPAEVARARVWLSELGYAVMEEQVA